MIHDDSTVLKITISLNQHFVGEPTNLLAPPPKIYNFPESSLIAFTSLRLSGWLSLTGGISHVKEFTLNLCITDLNESFNVFISHIKPPNK